MHEKIKKAVFPVAGLGTRFYPASKAGAKEMMPVVDKPLIQYAAEEAMEAGIETLIFISGKSKRSIEDHFDRDFSLEKHLVHSRKSQALARIRDIVPSSINCVYIRQPLPLGLGDAVLQAEPVIDKGESFVVVLADDLIDAPQGGSCTKQIIDVYHKNPNPDCCVCAVEEVPSKDVHKYGIVNAQPADNRSAQVWPVQDLVEKPSEKEAASTMAIIGRYVLHAGLFELLQKTPKSIGGEVQLTDAIRQYAQTHSVLAARYHGKRYDCGNVSNYLIANIEYGYKRPDIRQRLDRYFESRQKQAESGSKPKP